MRRDWIGGWAPVALGAALVAAAGVALAQAAPDVHVAYDVRGASCPSAGAFLGQLRARSGRVRLVDRSDGVRVLRVEIRGEGSRYAGRLTVREIDGSETERSFTGSTCAEVASGLAFVAAVALDPRAATGAEAPPVATQPTIDAGANATEPDASAARGQKSAPPTPVGEAADVADAGTKVAPADEEKVDVPPAEDAGAGQTRPWSVALGLDGQVVSGPAPSVLFVLPVFVEVASTSPRAWSPSARLGFQRASTTTTQSGGAGAAFTWSAASLDLCPVAWSPGALRLEPCLRTEAGLLQAAGIGVQPLRSATRLWGSVGPAARARWKAFGPAFLEVQGAGGLPFARDRFFIEPGTTVFHVPAVEWSAALGLGATIW